MKKVEWTPLKIFLTAGAVLGVVTAGATAWVQMGGAIPASQLYVTQSGEDIKSEIGSRLQLIEAEGRHQTRESAKHGREIYKSKVRGYLTLPPPTDTEHHTIWREDLDEAKRKQRYYEDLEIELLKK